MQTRVPLFPANPPWTSRSQALCLRLPVSTPSAMELRKRGREGDEGEGSTQGAGAAGVRAKPSPRLTIAVYNYKGGCAKSSCTRELAAAAATQGLQVCLPSLPDSHACGSTTPHQSTWAFNPPPPPPQIVYW